MTKKELHNHLDSAFRAWNEGNVSALFNLLGSIISALPDEKAPVRQEPVEGVIRFSVFNPRTGDSYQTDLAIEDGSMLFAHGIRIWPPPDRDDEAHRLVMEFAEAYFDWNMADDLLRKDRSKRVKLCEAQDALLGYWEKHKDGGR